jgi:hypothetical protein
MADSYPGPYQSKLLKFISKQSRQVADTCDRTWREIKVTALNATQILLYPAYLLVQGSRMLARQLRESTQKVDLPELSEFVSGENQNLSEVEIGSESAIGEILHLAENLVLPSQTSTSSGSFSFVINSANVAADIPLQPEIQFNGKPANAQKSSVLVEAQLAKTQISSVSEISNKPEVQGIATFITARTLVLVGTENQILDILTPEQQELLEGRIIWEVANSGPERRQIAEKELKFNLGLESAAEKSKHSPVRRFWQLMAWIQKSPIALKRNQFGESILAVKKAINASANRNLIASQTTSTQLEGFQIDRPAISPSNSIDRNSPKLELNFNNKFDRPTNNLSFVTLLDRAAANIEEISLPPVSKFTGTFTEIEPASPDSNLSPSAREILETYARSIESVIWSSVDYLLGKETAASDNTEKSVAIKYHLEHRELINTEKNESQTDRPWLNWKDLFGEPAPETIVGAVPPCPPSSTLPCPPPPILESVGAVPPCPPSSTPPCPPSSTQSESRSTVISTSPYPEAIQALVAQLKGSLFTKGEKSQPQNSNLPSTQKNSAARAESSTPDDGKETQLPKPTAPNNAQISQSPTAITAQTSRFVATGGTNAAPKPKNHSADPEQGNEYLETKAESMGYIKHPLEQVLEWLDRIMLRLETILEQVWKWAKINLPKIIRSKDKID